MLRFIAGFAGSVLVGFAVFRLRVFQVGNPHSQVIIIGGLVAGVLALWRIGRPVQSVALAIAFAVVQIPLTLQGGDAPVVTMLWRAVATFAWSLFVGFGACLVAAIYDRLAFLGMRFFKFLITGALLGGIYFAASPLAGLAAGRPESVAGVMWLNGLLGILIGDGVGLGVEIAENLPPLRHERAANADETPSD